MKTRIGPYLWSALVFIAALTLALVIAPENKEAMQQGGVPSQTTPLWLILTYFLSAVAVISAVLFIIPLKYLKYVFRAIFTLMFAWGVLVVASNFPGATTNLSDIISYVLAVIAAIAWLFFARIWLHDLLLLTALAAAASVFGYLFSPLTFLIFMLVISVYDVLAVRFGLMVWMADKLSESTSLPAFIFPKKVKDVTLNLKAVQFSELKKEEPGKREHTILGGGDIGFPLMFTVSVFFMYELQGALVVGFFALIGIMSAFIIQTWWLKGKPMPALPPITLFSLIGYLITRFFLA
jgi:presenilin-like A22 family membrane protease